jgi:putative transcriptional regulator
MSLPQLLAPGLLLAAPRLGDPNFERSVVLLGQHSGEGALGWVLNGRPLAPVGQLLRDAELVPSGTVLPATPEYQSQVRVGGPVAPDSAWLLFRNRSGEPLPEEALHLGGQSAITSSRGIIESVARGSGPSEFRLLLGYAGWGPMQLEGEIQQGAWLPAPVDLDLLFDLDPDDLWDNAYRLAVGANPMAFSAHKGSA